MSSKTVDLDNDNTEPGTDATVTPNKDDFPPRRTISETSDGTDAPFPISFTLTPEEEAGIKQAFEAFKEPEEEFIKLGELVDFLEEVEI